MIKQLKVIAVFTFCILLISTGCKKNEIKTDANSQLASRELQSLTPVVEIISLTSCEGCYWGDFTAEGLSLNKDIQALIIHHYGIPGVQSGEVHPNFIHDQYFHLFDQWGSTGYPMAAVNRRDFSQLSPPKNEKGIALWRESWNWASKQIRSETAKVNLGLKMEKLGHNSYKLTYEHYCTQDISPMSRLHIAITQSNIKAYLRGSGNDYIHNHVCRGFLSKKEGIDLSMAASKAKSHMSSIEFTIPELYGNGDLPTGGGRSIPEEMEIIAFVTSENGDIIGASKIDFP